MKLHYFDVLLNITDTVFIFQILITHLQTIFLYFFSARKVYPTAPKHIQKLWGKSEHHISKPRGLWVSISVSKTTDTVVHFAPGQKPLKQTTADTKLNLLTVVKQDCCLVSLCMQVDDVWGGNFGSNHCCQGCSAYSFLRFFLLLRTFSACICNSLSCISMASLKWFSIYCICIKHTLNLLIKMHRLRNFTWSPGDVGDLQCFLLRDQQITFPVKLIFLSGVPTYKVRCCTFESCSSTVNCFFQGGYGVAPVYQTHFYWIMHPCGRLLAGFLPDGWNSLYQYRAL